MESQQPHNRHKERQGKLQTQKELLFFELLSNFNSLSRAFHACLLGLLQYNNKNYFSLHPHLIFLLFSFNLFISLK